MPTPKMDKERKAQTTETEESGMETALKNIARKAADDLESVNDEGKEPKSEETKEEPKPEEAKEEAEEEPKDTEDKDEEDESEDEKGEKPKGGEAEVDVQNTYITEEIAEKYPFLKSFVGKPIDALIKQADEINRGNSRLAQSNKELKDKLEELEKVKADTKVKQDSSKQTTEEKLVAKATEQGYTVEEFDQLLADSYVEEATRKPLVESYRQTKMELDELKKTIKKHGDILERVERLGKVEAAKETLAKVLLEKGIDLKNKADSEAFQEAANRFMDGKPSAKVVELVRDDPEALVSVVMPYYKKEADAKTPSLRRKLDPKELEERANKNAKRSVKDEKPHTNAETLPDPDNPFGKAHINILRHLAEDDAGQAMLKAFLE